MQNEKESQVIISIYLFYTEDFKKPYAEDDNLPSIMWTVTVAVSASDGLHVYFPLSEGLADEMARLELGVFMFRVLVTTLSRPLSES